MAQGLLPVPGQAAASHVELYRQRSLIAALVCTLAFSLLMISLRIYTRGRLLRSVELDDWIMGAAVILMIIYTSLALITAVKGTGIITEASLDIQELILAAKIGFINNLLYWAVLFATSLSILILYARILSYTRAGLIAYGMIALVSAHWLTATLVSIFYCLPVRASWDPFVTSKKCISLNGAWVMVGLHIFLDCLIISLPLPMTVRVRIPRRKKRALYLIFSLGYLICGIGLARFVLLVHTANVAEQGKRFNPSIAAICTAVELNGGISIACLMTLRPLMSKWFPGWDLSTVGITKQSSKSTPRHPASSTRPTSTRRVYDQDLGAHFESDGAILMALKDRHIVSQREHVTNSNNGTSWLKLEDGDVEDKHYDVRNIHD